MGVVEQWASHNNKHTIISWGEQVSLVAVSTISKLQGLRNSSNLVGKGERDLS